jgi:hypothetical protein
VVVVGVVEFGSEAKVVVVVVSGSEDMVVVSQLHS